MVLPTEVAPRTSASDSIVWGDGGRSTGEASSRALQELCDAFEHCPIQQIAFDAICGELLRSPIQWVTADGKGDAAVDVPTGIDIAIVAAIKGLLVAGAFFWRKGTIRDDSPIVVAHPTEVWHGRRSKRWKYGRICEPFPMLHQIDQINSPCARALKQTIMLKEHELLLLNRDRLNSKPSVFIAVDSRIQNNDGHSRPWFRAVGREFVDSISEEMDSTNQSLDALVDDRSAVIEKLGSATLDRRKRAFAPGGGTADAEMLDSAYKHHREHVVRDGFVPTPVGALQSLSDGHRQIDRLENRILYAMQVPPCAVGRNVNSERMSSAPQLVMHSLRAYKTFIDRIRVLISTMLKDGVTDSDSDRHIAFAVQLDNFDLDRLESVMTPTAAAAAYAATFGIPRDWLSEDALRNRQGAMHGAQRTVKGEDSAVRQAKRARGPPPGSTDTA